MINQNNAYEQSDLYRIRHTAAHILAQAVLERYPRAKLAIGPPIKDGFYYDFDLGIDDNGKAVTFKPDDLPALEKGMRRVIAGRFPLVKKKLSAFAAHQLFLGQPYKLALLADLLNAGEAEVSTYRQDSFEDLCRGPHVDHTGQVPADAFRLLNVAGAYWRGDENEPMLQRIYGTAWRSKKELKAYLARLEAARARDHRKLGRQMELFYFHETAPGMPYWLPNGLKILNALIDFWREEHEARGYEEYASPLLNDASLFESSGHSDYYEEDMFIFPISEQRKLGLKPMNCPNAMILFGHKKRSYRELPLRIADTDILHRRERPGTLHGLLRVQRLQQDDAHIFLAEDQIEAEFDAVIDLIDRFYDIFGLKYKLWLSTRPEKYVGEKATWDRAETVLHRILQRHKGDAYDVNEGDGAFYGPKIDIMVEDALGREWQMGTVQLDFQLPQRFNLSYTDAAGQEKVPVVVHRVIYGSMERFIGLILEHFNGALPVWIAPVQVMLIPIADRHIAYAEALRRRLGPAGLRVKLDDSSNRMNAKIRAAQQLKVPYMVIIGDNEIENETISLRLRDGTQENGYGVDQLLARIQTHVATKSLAV